MRAGRLRHRVAIQAATDAKDAMGGVSETFATTATVWAEINPLGGAETFQSQQVAPAATHQVRIRYRSGLTTKHRVLYGTRVFDIESIQNLEERNKEILLVCTERLN